MSEITHVGKGQYYSSLYVSAGSSLTIWGGSVGTVILAGGLGVAYGGAVGRLVLHPGAHVQFWDAAVPGNIEFLGGAFEPGWDYCIGDNVSFYNNTKTTALHNRGVTLTVGDGVSFFDNQDGAILNFRADSITIIGDNAKFERNRAYWDVHNVETADCTSGVIGNLGTLTIGNDALFSENGTPAIINKNVAAIGDNAVFSGNNTAIISDGRIMDTEIEEDIYFSIGNNCSFQANMRGAIISFEGTFSIGDNAVFSGNTAATYVGDHEGGAIRNLATMEIGKNATFSENISEDGEGGAIYNTNTLNIEESAQFLNNQAAQGGAIYSRGAVTIGDKAVFSGNTAINGAGIYNISSSLFTLGDETCFVNNLATGSGGAICNSSLSFVVGNGAVFSGNGAKNGGAICDHSRGITIGNNACFFNNYAEMGGAICVKSNLNAPTTIGENAIFQKNTALNGGAIYVDGAGKITIADNAVFSGNTAKKGGVIYLSGMAEITGATFKGNTAEAGGAIYVDGGRMKLTDSVFATTKDTIHIQEGYIEIRGNVSFAGNVTFVPISENSSSSFIYNQGNIDLNISVRTEADGILLSSWTWAGGSAQNGTFSITVSDRQTAGVYQLAADVRRCDKIFTVKDTNGSVLGKLSLDMKKPLQLQDMSLMLVLDEETRIISVVVDSAFSETTDREKQETKIALPDTAFSNMTCSNYTLTQAPEWLTIDSATGVFSGVTGQITETETGYGTTEVIVSAQKGSETKEHSIEVVVIPENIAGDGALENSNLANLTDVVAEVITKRDEREISLELPGVTWDYCGLDVQLSELSSTLDISDSDYTVELQGKLALSIFDSGKKAEDRASLTVDLSGNNYVKITTPHDFGSMEIDVVGELNFSNISLADGFLLKEGVISVDTEKDIWSGNAEIKFVYFDKTLKAEYVVVDKKVDTLTIELSGLDIAVGSTGLFLESISGGVKNLSDGDNKPSQIVAGAGFYYGKQITVGSSSFSLANLDLDAVITNRSITGEGTVTVLGGILAGSVSASIDWKDASLSVKGSLTLANLVTAQGAIKIDCNGNIAYSTRSVIDFSKFGIDISASSNILLKFSNDNNNANDYYAAWCNQELFGTTQSFGVKFNLDGSWSLIGTQNISALNQDNPAAYSLRRSVPPVVQSWDFSDISETILITARWDSGEAEIQLCDNNGISYTIDEIKKHSDMEIVESMSGENSLVIAIRNPGSGEWSMSVANGENANISACSLNGNSILEKPVITAATGDNRTILLNWSCDEVPGNTELCIYYDTDELDNDGVLIAQITPETTAGTFTWDVPEVVGGNLYFYAVLSAPDQLPVIGEYTDPVEIKAEAQLVEVDSDGWTYVADGEYVHNAVITSGGLLEVGGGAITGETVIENDAEMILNEATVSGKINLAGSISVTGEIETADLGITFDLTERTPDSDYMLNDISRFAENTNYSITVSAETAAGKYKLAQGAEDFTAGITINNGEADLGTLNANSDAVLYEDKSYSLVKCDGEITLTVAIIDTVAPLAPIASANITAATNGKVTVFAKFSEDSVVREYSLNGDEWSVYARGIDFFENGKVYFRGQDAAGNYSDIVEYSVDNIDTVADSITDEYVFISSKYTDKINGKKQNGITLIYGTNAFASLEAAGDTSGKTVILLDSKNSGNYADQSTVAGVVVIPTVKYSGNSYSYKANSTPKGTLNLTADTGSTGFIRFATVNVTGAAVGNISGSKESSSENTKSTVDKKGTITDTGKFTYSANANGKFTALDASAKTISGYATVNLTASKADNLSGGSEKVSISTKTVDAADKDQKNISKTMESAASGSATLKTGASVDALLNGYSKVTLTDSTAENITNFTSKDSQSESAAYDEAKNTVTRKVTVTHTETTAGTLQATNAELGNVTGFATVTLKDVIGSGNFRRVDADGDVYSTVKKTLDIKTSKNGSVAGTYNKTETFTNGGKFTATDSTAGDIENFSSVILDGSAVDDISNFTTAKIVTKGTASWDDMTAYGRPEDYDIDLTGWDWTVTETKSLNGSVTMKNGSYANSITGFKSVSLTGSEVEKIDNVNKVTVNKGDSIIGSYTGTDGKDSLTIAKGAVLTIGGIDLDKTNDKLVNNGTVILSQWIDLNKLTISGKGEFAAAADVLAEHSSDKILNLGATAKNFRGTAYEKADDLLNKAVKMDGDEYNGWLGSWEDTETGFDSVDCLKVKVSAETTLTVSGDVNWTLWDKKGKEELGQLTTLASGEYIIQIQQNKDKGSLAYSVTLK